ncbi:CRISPR-associated endonuclease Cas2 [Gleimia sp. 6138-11-ORH1]|uniref:CRISPR-associated endonuclease Cas2 n=1 Tax=Gleimia sp. 6138-11-ORH1 TaxID=2973937 RepID=UPI002169DF6E|nr:CRISPR-associated endonuclease Cas2 [Gleimia sp. 6138-11-ORH1]MCS4483929.1 CRISPR-associated endonuclease Cas2 [Gleimia sp. 6138-11-ORH1]
MADDPMWLLVMFDLPVTTKKERRDATAFRNLLLDSGFSMVQFSVYARYRPTGGSDIRVVSGIKANVPSGGKVRILQITDRQWSTMLRFSNRQIENDPETPEQLTIF